MNLQNLLTEKDFELLNKAVDALPKLGFSSMMMIELLMAGLTKNEDKEQREREREERIAKQKLEDVVIEGQCLELKYKLLQLKRMIHNDTRKEN